jgi:radical SAM protein with 4Fe4S-binding SPASM domain
MKNILLKPYVYKVVGAKKIVFYDSYNGKLYQVEKEGDLIEFIDQLKKAKLIFYSTGIVPAKFKYPFFKSYLQSFLVDEIQIRLNGNIENNCWQRMPIIVHKNKIKKNIFIKILNEINLISFDKLRLECEFINKSDLDLIIKYLPEKKIDIYTEKKNYKKIESIKIASGNAGNDRMKIQCKEKDNLGTIQVDNFRFNFNQHFNPCLGRKIAIDYNGNIKPCLWAKKSIGNVEKESLNELLLKNKFAVYWELKKDNIHICSECELRYFCNDCRIIRNNEISVHEKPSFCNYNPR